MPRTRDSFPGKRFEDEILFETNSTPDGGAGSASFNGTSHVFQDAAGTYNPRFSTDLNWRRHFLLMGG